MKHAGPTTLDELEPVLRKVRLLPGVTEKKRGIFYRKGQAFLHFHEDPNGLFADVKLEKGGDFTRYRVSTEVERQKFLSLARKVAAL